MAKKEEYTLQDAVTNLYGKAKVFYKEKNQRRISKLQEDITKLQEEQQIKELEKQKRQLEDKLGYNQEEEYD